jgi:hypothetical protein
MVARREGENKHHEQGKTKSGGASSGGREHNDASTQGDSKTLDMIRKSYKNSTRTRSGVGAGVLGLGLGSSSGLRSKKSRDEGKVMTLVNKNKKSASGGAGASSHHGGNGGDNNSIFHRSTTGSRSKSPSRRIVAGIPQSLRESSANNSNGGYMSGNEDTHSRGTARSRRSGASGMTKGSAKSCVTRSSAVTTLYQQRKEKRQAKKNEVLEEKMTPSEKILARVRQMAGVAQKLENVNQPGQAIAKHTELQDLVIATLTSSLNETSSSHDEAMLRFALADSSLHMSVIYEVTFNDLDNAIAHYLKTLNHYRDLRLHLAVAGLFNSNPTDKEERHSGQQHLQHELSGRIGATLARLSESYIKQDKWQFAKQVCHDALDVLGVQCHDTDKKCRKKTSKKLSKDLLLLYTQVLDMLIVIEPKLVLEVDSNNANKTKTSSSRRGSESKSDSHTRTTRKFEERQETDSCSAYELATSSHQTYDQTNHNTYNDYFSTLEEKQRQHHPQDADRAAYRRNDDALFDGISAFFPSSDESTTRDDEERSRFQLHQQRQQQVKQQQGRGDGAGDNTRFSHQRKQDDRDHDDAKRGEHHKQGTWLERAIVKLAEKHLGACIFSGINSSASGDTI